MARRKRGGRTTPKGTRPNQPVPARAPQSPTGEELLLRDAAWALEQGAREIDDLAATVASLVEPSDASRDQVFAPLRLLKECERAGDGAGLLVARAIEVLGRAEVRDRAAVVVGRIEDSVDAATRTVIGSMGRLEPQRAFAVTDPHHDATALYLEGSRPDGEGIAVRILCEAAFRGAAAEFGYGVSARRAHELAERDADAIVEDVSLPDARAWMEHAVAMRNAEYVADPDDENEMIALEHKAIVVHYFRQCPDKGELPPRARLTSPDELPAMVAAFVSSPLAEGLDDAAVIAPELAEFGMVVSGRPLWWSPLVAEVFGQYAGHVFDDDLSRRLAPVTKAWARWAAKRLDKSPATIADTVTAIDTNLRRAISPPQPSANVLTLPGLEPITDDVEESIDEEWLLRAWTKHEARVADLVRDSLDSRRGAPTPSVAADTAEAIRHGVAEHTWPYQMLAHLRASTATRLTAMTDTDVVMWAASAMIDPDPMLDLVDDNSDTEEELVGHVALAGLMDPIDWAQLVIALSNLGAGTSCEPAELADIVTEADGTGDDDAELIEALFEANRPLWRAAGICDADDRLTPLGVWALPRALCRALGTEFD